MYLILKRCKESRKLSEIILPASLWEKAPSVCTLQKSLLRRFIPLLDGLGSG